MNASAFLGSSSLTAHTCCERLYVKVGRSTRGRRLQQRISAVGWVRSSAVRDPFTPFIRWSNYSTFSHCKVQHTLLHTSQDPEGILAAPKGGHISRRTFQKQLAEDKTLAEQVEREREVARQELQARRDVRGFILLCFHGMRSHVNSLHLAGSVAIKKPHPASCTILIPRMSSVTV